jgi:hypothetical protein
MTLAPFPSPTWVTPDPGTSTDIAGSLHLGSRRLAVVRTERDPTGQLLGYLLTWDPPEDGCPPLAGSFSRTGCFPSLLMARHYAEIYGRVYVRRYLF